MNTSFIKMFSLGLLSLFVFANLLFAQNSTSESIPDNSSTGNSNIGYLSIEADVDSFFVVLDNNFKQAVQVSNNDTLAVATGRHSVRVIKKYYKDSIFKTEIKGGEVSRVRTNLLTIKDLNKPSKKLSSYPRLAWNASLVVKTDPEATIYINDKNVGTGIGSTNIVGPAKIRTELPSGVSTSKFMVLKETSQAFYVEELYNKPEKGKAMRLSILPGASQIYQREYLKGYLLLGTTLLGAGLYLKKESDYQKQYDKYRKVLSGYAGYIDSGEPDKAQSAYQAALVEEDKANQIAKVRDYALYTTLGIYAFSLIDGLIKPKNGYRKTIEIDPYIDFNRQTFNKAGLSASYNF